MFSVIHRASHGLNFPRSIPWTRKVGGTTCCFRSTAKKMYALQKCGFATKIRVSLPDEIFFNREREIRSFEQVLRSEPQLSIVTGPVNSGKTALLRKILQEQSEKYNRPVLHLDLRSRSFNTVNEFTSSLETEMNSWLDGVAKGAKELNPHVSVEVIEVKASLGDRSLETSPIERLNSLFAKMDRQLSPYSWWTGKQHPILFIDEASKLHQLLQDKQGHAALTNMFDWYIRNTKQDHRFHVILGSSDSFFHLWVARYVGSDRFTSYVVGNLTRSEAQKFWETKVITQIHRQDGLKTPLFNHAYKVCGGNMFLLEKYCSQYLQREGKMRPGDFSSIKMEKMRLLRAYFKNENNFPFAHTGKEGPIWNQEQFIKMMEKLTKAKNGFLIYGDLCKEIGSDVVNAFIDYNLLHLRPSEDFAYDLLGVPQGESVLTAETPASLVAMRKLLIDIKNGRL